MPRNDGQHIEQLAQSRDRDSVRDVAAELADLPWVRLTQREAPPRDRRSPWLLVAMVIAAHVLLGWVAYLILRPAPYSRDESGVFTVSLIESGSELPPPPPLVPPPPLQGQPAAPARRLHYVPPAKGAISATLEGVKGPPLQLYDSKGQVRLPPGSGKPAQARGLIVESSFTSLADIAADLTFSWIPTSILLTQKFDSVDKIKSVDIPVLIVHGKGDRYVSPHFSESLFEAARMPKKLLLLPRDFSVEGGELTPTLKVRRRIVEERHRAAIERLYQEGAA